MLRRAISVLVPFYLCLTDIHFLHHRVFLFFSLLFARRLMFSDKPLHDIYWQLALFSLRNSSLCSMDVIVVNKQVFLPLSSCSPVGSQLEFPFCGFSSKSSFCLFFLFYHGEGFRRKAAIIFSHKFKVRRWNGFRVCRTFLSLMHIVDKKLLRQLNAFLSNFVHISWRLS